MNKIKAFVCLLLMASCTHRTQPSADTSKSKTQTPQVIVSGKPVKFHAACDEDDESEQEDSDSILRVKEREIKLLKNSVIAKANFYVKIATLEGIDKIVLQFKKTDEKESFVKESSYKDDLPVAVPHKITYLAKGQQLFVSTKDAEGKWSYSGEQGTPLPAFEELSIDLDGMVIPGKNVGTNNPILFRVIKGYPYLRLHQNPDCLYDFYDNVRDNPCMVAYACGDNEGTSFSDNIWPTIILHQNTDGSIAATPKFKGKKEGPKFPDDELIRNARVLKVYMEFID